MFKGLNVEQKRLLEEAHKREVYLRTYSRLLKEDPLKAKEWYDSWIKK